MEKSNIIITGLCIILGILILRLILPTERKNVENMEIPVSHDMNNNTGNIQLIQQEEEPVINEEPKYVSLYPDLYADPLVEFSSPEDGKKIAFLTFDDGPSDNTCEVLDILKKENIKATFFIVGENITENRLDCLKKIVEDGHTIGLHCYCHDYDKVYSSVDGFLEDYDKLNQIIYEQTGVKPNIYRFPGGSYFSYNKSIKNEVIAEMERRGFTYYDWNVSAEDSVGTPTKYSIMKNIRKDIFRYQCPVVLMHDSEINALTAQLLPDIISEIREEGYEFDTLEKREPCQF